MKRTRIKWKNSLALILFFSLAVATATGIYLYRIVPQIYKTETTFFALPAGAQTEKNGGQLTRMLARDADQLTKTDSFRAEVMKTAPSDGKTRVYVRGDGRSHTIRVVAWGYDAAATAKLCAAAGQLVMEKAGSLFLATGVSLLTPAEDPAPPLRYYRPIATAAAFLAAFLLFSLLGMLFGSPYRRLKYGKSTGDIPLPCLGGFCSLKKSLRRKNAARKKEPVALYDMIDNQSLAKVQQLTARLKGLQTRRGLSLTVAGMDKDTDSAALTALLGSELAVQGSGVLLIEMDSYRPALSKILDRKGRLDVLDCVESQEAYSEAVLPTDVEGLYFLDACHQPGFVSRLAGTEKFASFLHDAVRTFQYVILHAPAVDKHNEASLLGRLTELVLLVADDGRHDTAELEEEARSLGRSVRQVAGYVLQDVPKRRAGRKEVSFTALPG